MAGTRRGLEEHQGGHGPPVFSPSSKPVDNLIRAMRSDRIKMVIVVDEFGGTSGLVTLEDLRGEIVGEIQDEHEADEPDDSVYLATGDVQIWGGVALREAARELRMELPVDCFDTVGGYVFGRLNRIPRVGDVVQGPGGQFKVAKMKGRRVEFVRFRPAPPRWEFSGKFPSSLDHFDSFFYHRACPHQSSHREGPREGRVQRLDRFRPGLGRGVSSGLVSVFLGYGPSPFCSTPFSSWRPVTYGSGWIPLRSGSFSG